MRSLLLAALLALPALAPAQTVPATFRFAKAKAGEIAPVVNALATVPAGASRTLAASRGFLGTAYVHSPLGEGAGPDRDPRIRWDGVDCLTLVETSLALGNASNLEEARLLLDDIRYADGTAPRFENRLHLMEAQWIPDQIRKGYLEEVTARYGGDATVEASISYDEARWKSRPGSLSHVPWSESLRGRHSVPMIPIADAIRIAPTLPAGLVIDVVRMPRTDRINRITHTGLIVEIGGAKYVRHAAFNRGEVIDEPIERFLRRHAGMRRWRVAGIHLLAIRDNHARVAQLAARTATP